MKAELIETTTPLKAIYTEESISIPHEQSDVEKHKHTNSIHARAHRTLMFRQSRATSVGTSLGLGNLCF